MTNTTKKVMVTEDHEGTPKGSVFPVDKETDSSYSGLHCSPYGSYYITIPKEKCREITN